MKTNLTAKRQGRNSIMKARKEEKIKHGKN